MSFAFFFLFLVDLHSSKIFFICIAMGLLKNQKKRIKKNLRCCCCHCFSYSSTRFPIHFVHSFEISTNLDSFSTFKTIYIYIFFQQKSLIYQKKKNMKGKKKKWSTINSFEEKINLLSLSFQICNVYSVSHQFSTIPSSVQ